MTRLRVFAGFCYVVALVAAFFCVGRSLQQAEFESLEAEIQPVRARLVAKEVNEWIEGHDDWAAFGIFEIEPGDYQGRAKGDLIPESFYEARDLRRVESLVPRADAEKFLPSWKIGNVYDGYIYPDAKDRIFFDLPGAEANALETRRLGYISGIFLTLGLVASCCVVYVARRRNNNLKS